jgi:hypothetical protein
LGDEAQITSLKVKKPGLLERLTSRLRHRTPNAHLHVTIKF